MEEVRQVGRDEIGEEKGFSMDNAESSHLHAFLHHTILYGKSGKIGQEKFIETFHSLKLS